MSVITQQILEDMENLPPEMQTEALDFVRFLKIKLIKTEAAVLEQEPNGRKAAGIWKFSCLWYISTQLHQEIKNFDERIGLSETTRPTHQKGTFMQLKKQLKQNMALIFFSTLFSAYNPAMAESDMQIQERVLKAREMLNQQNTDHAAHVNPVDKSQEFHGVFYGFLPCNDCNGIKATLSLKQKNNYLLVTQPARDSSREYYEKGKYSWNDENRTVVLTPRKESGTKQYHIEDEGTLVQLSPDGARMTGDEADRYILRRSDTVKSREVHIH